MAAPPSSPRRHIPRRSSRARGCLLARPPPLSRPHRRLPPANPTSAPTHRCSGPSRRRPRSTPCCRLRPPPGGMSKRSESSRMPASCCLPSPKPSPTRQLTRSDLQPSRPALSASLCRHRAVQSGWTAFSNTVWWTPEMTPLLPAKRAQLPSHSRIRRVPRRDRTERAAATTPPLSRSPPTLRPLRPSTTRLLSSRGLRRQS